MIYSFLAIVVIVTAVTVVICPPMGIPLSVALVLLMLWPNVKMFAFSVGLLIGAIVTFARSTP